MKSFFKFYISVFREEGIVALAVIILAAFLVLGGIMGFIYFSEQKQKLTDKCGDGICGPLEVEQADSDLCLIDCEQKSANQNATTSAVVLPPGTSSSAPYYFVAIHNEAYNYPNGEKDIKADYQVLKEIIRKSEEKNIRLTLMFTPQWVNYILEDSARTADLESWKKNGHEIAVHHHGLSHGNWDGYTNYPESEARDKRKNIATRNEYYYGTMADYIAVLKKLNPDFKSGCFGDIKDSREAIDQVVTDACGVFLNYGDPGEIPDKKTLFSDAKAGENDYSTTAVINGIKRNFLVHYPVISAENEKRAEKIFSSMTKGVYGIVLHSQKDQAVYYYKFLDYLHNLDPKGEKNKTLSEVVPAKILEEKKVSSSLLNQEADGDFYENQVNTATGKCGDGVCGPLEKNIPILCPQDCAAN